MYVLQVGCAEFMLLVVLLCAGAAQQQIQAVHAYAGSISRVFLGKLFTQGFTLSSRGYQPFQHALLTTAGQQQ